MCRLFCAGIEKLTFLFFCKNKVQKCHNSYSDFLKKMRDDEAGGGVAKMTWVEERDQKSLW